LDFETKNAINRIVGNLIVEFSSKITGLFFNNRWKFVPNSLGFSLYYFLDARFSRETRQPIHFVEQSIQRLGCTIHI